MKYIYILTFVGLLVSTSSYCQKNIPKKVKKSPVEELTFNTSQGEVKVTVPSQICAKDVISGTVVTAPSGKSEKEIKKNSALLSGYVVDVDHQSESVQNKHHTWKIPADKTDKVFFTLKDNKGVEIGRKAVTLSTIHFLNKAIPQPFQELPFINDYYQAGDPGIIPGNFDGNFNNTQLLINNQAVEPLAESPRMLVFNVPDLSGPQLISVADNNFTKTKKVNILQLDLSADKLTLISGETTNIHLQIKGLKDLTTTVPLTITNNTPNNIQTSIKNPYTVLIDPLHDSAIRETFSLDFTGRALQNGSFTIEADILPPKVNYDLRKLITPDIVPDNNLKALTVMPEKIKQCDFNAISDFENTEEIINETACTRLISGLLQSATTNEETKAVTFRLTDEMEFTFTLSRTMLLISVDDVLDGELHGEMVLGRCHCPSQEELNMVKATYEKFFDWITRCLALLIGFDQDELTQFNVEVNCVESEGESRIIITGHSQFD